MINLSIDQWPGQQKQCQLSIEIEKWKKEGLKKLNEELKQKALKQLYESKNN